MHKIVVFGKGGIGKSTITSNLAVTYAKRGMRVLLVGCDPKHDTTVSVTGGEPIQTAVDLPGFMDLKAKAEQFVVRGAFGIDCVESGGPEPGIGCAGRGISRTIEMLESCKVLREGRYDVVLFDVLGDVVCGGFAAPLRMGFAEKVCIVASEEVMALYAANNIARAIRNYSSNGIALCGLVANLKDPGSQRKVVERFARLIGTRVLAFLPRDPAVRQAEYAGASVVERFPRSGFARRLADLAEVLLALDSAKIQVPRPLSDRDFHRLSRESFEGEVPAAESAGPPAAAQGESQRSWGVRPRPVVPSRQAPDERLEMALAAWAQAEEGKGGWVDGPHARQWGDPQQWRNFFCDREAARNADQQVYLDAPVFWISHEDLECHYATPFFNDGYGSYFNFPWPQRWGSAERFQPNRDGFTTDLRDADVVRGGSQKLAEALELAMKRSRGKAAVLVTSTCVPNVIGDDAVGAVEQYRRRSEIPVLYSSPASGQELNLLEYFFRHIKQSAQFKSARPKPRSVNLIGFPPGRGRQELAEMLGRAGIEVNAMLLPRLALEEAQACAAASLNVFYPNPGFRDLYGKLFGDLEMRAITPVAPYGLENTRRWLWEVGRGLGYEDPSWTDEVWRGYAQEAGKGWEQAREEVKGRRLGFVLDAERVRRLTDPSGMAGVPLVAMLKEMGFGIDYLVYAEGQPPALEAPEGRHGVRWFHTPQQLRELLEGAGCDAFYSEFSFDRRLTRAGKAQFSLLDVEMGVSGAVRSLERLAGLCRWPFYKRYGKDTEE